MVAQPEDIPDEDAEDQAEAGGEAVETPINRLKTKEQRTMSTPVLSSENGVKSRTGKKGSINSLSDLGSGLSSAIERSSRPEPPRIMRSTSFAAAANPMVTVNNADSDSSRRDSDLLRKRDEASAILKDLSTRSGTASPSESPYGSPPKESTTDSSSKNESADISAKASRESLRPSHARRQSAGSSIQSPTQSSIPHSPSSETFGSSAASVNEDPKPNKGFSAAARSLTATDRKQALASINAATAAAQKWGWGVINRNKQKEAEAATKAKALSSPMGRGHPLPPPGTPLPPPERNSAGSMPFALPKRKPVPPPLLPKRPAPDANGPSNDPSHASQPSQKPALPERPERRNRLSSFQGDDQHADEVLVVEAPVESAPTSPALNEHRDDFFGHGEEESSMGAWESSVLPDEESAPAPASDGDTQSEQKHLPEH